MGEAALSLEFPWKVTHITPRVKPVHQCTRYRPVHQCQLLLQCSALPGRCAWLQFSIFVAVSTFVSAPTVLTLTVSIFVAVFARVPVRRTLSAPPPSRSAPAATTAPHRDVHTHKRTPAPLAAQHHLNTQLHCHSFAPRTQLQCECPRSDPYPRALPRARVRASELSERAHSAALLRLLLPRCTLALSSSAAQRLCT